MHKPGYRLALFATFLAVVVVLLGAYTRLTHAGLGCPDWPGCYGFLGVPMSEHKQAIAEARFPEAPVEIAKGWYEMIHRYFAGSLGLVILFIATQAVRRREEPMQPVKLPLAILALVILQGAFGMWTVTLQLWPQVVTAHLLGGFATLSLLTLLTLRLSGRFAPLQLPGRLRALAAACLLLVIGQIALGGWVSSNYAAVACVDLPTCHGEWWPAMDFGKGFHLTQHIGPNYLGGQLDSDARTAIHMSHRIGAALVTLALLVLAWRLYAARLSRLAGLLVLALAVQVSLGISNVVFHLPLLVAVAHNAGGAALLLTTVLINYRLRAASAAPRTTSDLVGNRTTPVSSGLVQGR